MITFEVLTIFSINFLICSGCVNVEPFTTSFGRSALVLMRAFRTSTREQLFSFKLSYNIIKEWNKSGRKSCRKLWGKCGEIIVFVTSKIAYQHFRFIDNSCEILEILDLFCFSNHAKRSQQRDTDIFLTVTVTLDNFLYMHQVSRLLLDL